MSTLGQKIESATRSPWRRWLFNKVMLRRVPFNAPHRLRILKATPGMALVFLPYRRSNLNHLNSMHACALATACEYASGISLITVLPEQGLRIIMKSMAVEYHYQARMDVHVQIAFDPDRIKNTIMEELSRTGKATYTQEVVAADVEGNKICTAQVSWQFKKWEQVKTKV